MKLIFKVCASYVTLESQLKKEVAGGNVDKHPRRNGGVTRTEGEGKSLWIVPRIPVSPLTHKMEVQRGGLMTIF